MTDTIIRRSLGARHWTAEELQQLRVLAATGAPAKIIALKLRRSVEAVRTTASREGIALGKSKGV